MIINHSAFSAKHRALLPVLSLLFSATLWGLIWYPLRILEDAGMHGIWSSLLIYCGTLIVAIPVILKGWRECLVHPWLFLFMSLATGWTNIGFILAVIDGNVVRVLLLFYLSPVWATLLGVFFLGEKLSVRAIFILIMAMTGAVIMLWPETSGFNNTITTSDWLALSSGIAFAITNVFIHKLNDASVMMKTSMGWMGVIVIALVIIMITNQPLQASTTAISGAWLLGALVMTLMNIAVVYGVTNMPVYRSAVILLFEIVVGAVSAILLTDEIILYREWIGGALVILAAYLTATSQIEHPAN